MREFIEKRRNCNKCQDNQWQNDDQLECYQYDDGSESGIDLFNKIFIEKLQEREDEPYSYPQASQEIISKPESSNFPTLNNSHDQEFGLSSTSPEKNNLKRNHLIRKRRRGSKKTKLQNSTQQYYLKNFLQFGKTPHFSFLKQQKGQKFLLKISTLRAIMDKKNAITMKEYVDLYSIPELEQVWKKFFSSKYLYRYLMLSRALPNYKRIFINLMHRYEEVFITKKFDGINRIECEQETSQSKSG